MEREESRALFNSSPFRFRKVVENVPRNKFQESRRDPNRRRETLEHAKGMERMLRINSSCNAQSGPFAHCICCSIWRPIHN